MDEKSKKSESKELGRPLRSFDWKLLEDLASMNAEERYIAECMLVSEKVYVDYKSINSKVKLIERRIKARYNCTYVVFKEQKQEAARLKILGWQMLACEMLNPTMLIWMGKQKLGQRDNTDKQKVVLSVTEENPQKKLSPDDYARILEKESEK